MSFHFLNSVFGSIKAFTFLMNSLFIRVFFIDGTFGVISKNSI